MPESRRMRKRGLENQAGVDGSVEQQIQSFPTLNKCIRVRVRGCEKHNNYYNDVVRMMKTRRTRNKNPQRNEGDEGAFSQMLIRFRSAKALCDTACGNAEKRPTISLDTRRQDGTEVPNYTRPEAGSAARALHLVEHMTPISAPSPPVRRTPRCRDAR